MEKGEKWFMEDKSQISIMVHKVYREGTDSQRWTEFFGIYVKKKRKR